MDVAMWRTIPKYVFTWLQVSKLPILTRMNYLRGVLEGQTQAYICGIELRTRITNETAIMKEGSHRLRNDNESHTTSLLDNRECNYRQSSVIGCSLLTSLGCQQWRISKRCYAWTPYKTVQ